MVKSTKQYNLYNQSTHKCTCKEFKGDNDMWEYCIGHRLWSIEVEHCYNTGCEPYTHNFDHNGDVICELNLKN